MVKQKDKQILIYYIFLQYIKQMYIAQFLSANNDTELEYDANGNVILYGDREFTWTYGRSLASVLDGMDEYTYTYDENGIRTSKTVDDVTTYYNTKDGVILSQTDGENTWYFQYDTSGTPLGFVLNGTQYFYITNQMNDVLAITDTNGDIVGNYEYDAWGKVLTADTDLAKQNPLRYRGYYYDNETGYYYLQSRYYDSNICRFINADEYQISQNSKNIIYGNNVFLYCYNSPINKNDPFGQNSEVVVFYYKPRFNYYKKSSFGHLDIKIDGVIYSYAKYESGNLLVTTNQMKYHNYQSSKYKVNYCIISVSTSKKNDILRFIKDQLRNSSYKSNASFDNSNNSKIYKINRGKYVNYKLTTVNCSTFVLDALKEAFSLKIMLYRFIQIIDSYLAYRINKGLLNTPEKVFEICKWLAEVSR